LIRRCTKVLTNYGSSQEHLSQSIMKYSKPSRMTNNILFTKKPNKQMNIENAVIYCIHIPLSQLITADSCITGNEREIISRIFYPYFPRFFPCVSRLFFSLGTPLDYRYEQWNCESNLYRVTIDLLPPMLNHFPLLICAISRD
jgi:hypothetical protein